MNRIEPLHLEKEKPLQVPIALLVLMDATSRTKEDIAQPSVRAWRK